MVIADRYELVGRLGRRDMGEVRQARYLSLNVDVAVKSIRTHPKDTSEPHRSALAYARNEAQHAAALRDHPNIVAVHDAVEHAQSVIHQPPARRPPAVHSFASSCPNTRPTRLDPRDQQAPVLTPVRRTRDTATCHHPLQQRHVEQ
ncbi:hypothetical protein [Streptomyces platensis]|uniref:hypothetical protein n=1 Tax=Streptomyces platensis TaxID=58346 RepID=UPI003325BD12